MILLESLSNNFFLYYVLYISLHPATKWAFIGDVGVGTGLSQMHMVNFKQRPKGAMGSRGGRLWELVQHLDIESTGRRYLLLGVLGMPLQANREHCVILCGGSYNTSGGRTHSLFWGELWDTGTLFKRSLRLRCRTGRAVPLGHRAQCAHEVAPCQGRPEVLQLDHQSRSNCPVLQWVQHP